MTSRQPAAIMIGDRTKRLFVVACLLGCYHCIEVTGFVVHTIAYQRNHQHNLDRKSSMLFGRDAGDEVGKDAFVDDSPPRDRMAEIEAMGGDPFFLTEEDESDKAFDSESTESDGVANVIGEEERFATDGKGPSPKGVFEDDPPFVEWDGIVNEDAHFDFD